MSANPIPPPQQRSQAIWWVLGIIGGGFVVMMILGLFVALYIAHSSIHVDNRSKSVEVNTPVGKIAVDAGKTPDTGLPVYPGATADAHNRANIEISAPFAGQLGVAAAKYYTNDSLDQVDAWYRDHLGEGFERQSPARGTHRSPQVHIDDANVAFVWDNGEMVRLVTLKQRISGIEIGLARFGKSEAQ